MAWPVEAPDVEFAPRVFLPKPPDVKTHLALHLTPFFIFVSAPITKKRNTARQARNKTNGGNSDVARLQRLLTDNTEKVDQEQINKKAIQKHFFFSSASRR